MSRLTVRLDPDDLNELVTRLHGLLREDLRPLLDLARSEGKEGVRLLSPADVAVALRKSVRHLKRLEREGKLPRRRQIGRRKTAYLAHEIEGLEPGAVMIEDARSLSREELAAKLGLHERTVTKMVGEGGLPEPLIGGRWMEREIDRWLVERPRARGGEGEPEA